MMGGEKNMKISAESQDTEQPDVLVTHVSFAHLAVEIAAHGLLGPWLVVKRCPPLFFRVSNHVCH